MIGLSAGISGSILVLIVLLIIIIIVVALWINFRRRALKYKQNLKPESEDVAYNHTELQENTNDNKQFHSRYLTELNRSIENKVTSNVFLKPHTAFQGIYSIDPPVSKEYKPEFQEMEALENDPTYATVAKQRDEQIKPDERSHKSPSSLYKNQQLIEINDEPSTTDDNKSEHSEKTLEDMYAVASKKFKVEKRRTSFIGCVSRSRCG